MNKPEAFKNLIPVREYAKTRISRRGFPVSTKYIYKLIAEFKRGERSLDFKFKEIEKQIWIIKDN